MAAAAASDGNGERQRTTQQPAHKGGKGGRGRPGVWQQRATDSDSERRSATASSVHKWEERAHRRGPSSSVHGCSLTKVTHPTTARAQAHSWHCLNTTTAGLARRARAHQGPTSPMAQAQFTALPHGQKALRAPARYHSTLSRGRERGRRWGREGGREGGKERKTWCVWNAG